VKGHSVRSTAITVLAEKQFSVVRIKGVTGMLRIINIEMLFKLLHFCNIKTKGDHNFISEILLFITT
jgi:hypothetical protein